MFEPELSPLAARGNVVTCHCCEGWICEAHPDQPYPHGECAGPSQPCSGPDCPWWRGPAPAALDTSDWTIEASTRARVKKRVH